jgi:hypothetical protein
MSFKNLAGEPTSTLVFPQDMEKISINDAQFAPTRFMVSNTVARFGAAKAIGDCIRNAIDQTNYAVNAKPASSIAFADAVSNHQEIA